MADADETLYSTHGLALLDTLRAIGQGYDADTSEREILATIGLADQHGLTEGGRRIYMTRWVQRDEKTALAMLGQALRLTLPVQVLEQELRGLGPVAEDGALDLLRLHRAAPPSLTLEAARRTFRWLNDVGVVTYDRRNKTVRSHAPPEDAPLAGEDRSLAAMISPNSPFSNIVRLRRIIRTLKGTVIWVDPHFGRRVLEDLAEELDHSAVKVVRILSGQSDDVLSSRSWNDFQRFRDELEQRGTMAEWRFDPKRDWHDRWLFDHEGGYNMPPINTLYQGSYSEMLPAAHRPPLDEWWNRSNVWTRTT